MKKITNNPKGVSFNAAQNKAVDGFVATSASLDTAHGAMRDACLALIASGLKKWGDVLPALEERKIDRKAVLKLRSNWYHYSNPKKRKAKAKRKAGKSKAIEVTASSFNGMEFAKELSGQKGFNKAKLIAHFEAALAFLRTL